MKDILHLVNGASLAGSLKTTGKIDQIAYWHEALYIGPLEVMSDPDFRTMREKWWGAEFPPNWVLHNKNTKRVFPHLTALLSELSRYDSIIFWFEYDLYDQSMLWYILRIFAERQKDLPPLSIISPDSFPGIDVFRGLGQLNPQQIETLIGTEVVIPNAHLASAAELWETFASNDLDRIGEMANRPHPFPYAGRALRARMSYYPTSPRGINDIQLALLRCIDRYGTCKVSRIIGDVITTYDPDYGLSDYAALNDLVHLGEDRRNLIEFVRNKKVVSWNAALIRDTEVRATNTGIALLQ